ncbi:MAG: response regulator transcription factor [bacterium]|nr:response regulator transcription factor [bacterium]
MMSVARLPSLCRAWLPFHISVLVTKAAGTQSARGITGRDRIARYYAKLCLILPDVMMPGMDGYEVYERLKAELATQQLPIIFFTAKTETEDVVIGFEIGGVDYVTKPFKAVELLAR